MPPALDPLLHQPTRLQIMSVLYRNRQASFTDLRDGLGLTPGNLASHTTKLEEAGYLRSGRVLVDLSFEVTYRLTPVGAAAFAAYLQTLQAVIDEARGDASGEAPAAAASDGAAQRDPAAPRDRDSPRDPAAPRDRDSPRDRDAAPPPL